MMGNRWVQTCNLQAQQINAEVVQMSVARYERWMPNVPVLQVGSILVHI